MTNTRTECIKSDTNGWSAYFDVNQDAITNRFGNRTYNIEYNNIRYSLGNATYVINPGGKENIFQSKLTLTASNWVDIPSVPSTWENSGNTTKIPMMMGIFQEILYLTFLDESGILNISTNTGDSWSALTPISSSWNSIDISTAVAIGVYNDDQLFIAMVSNSQIYLSTLDGNSWSEPTEPLWTDFKTDLAVSMAYYDADGKLYMVMVGTDQQAYYATYDGSNWSSEPQLIFSGWPNKIVLQSMALASFSGKLCLSILGTKSTSNQDVDDSSDGSFYFTTYDDTDGWSTKPTLYFASFSKNHSTDCTLYLSGTSNALYVSYVDTVGNVYAASANKFTQGGMNWPSGPTQLFENWGKSISQAAPLATYNNILYLSCSDSDGIPYIASRTSNVSWPESGVAINSLTSATIEHAVACAAFNDLFYLAYISTDADNNNRIYLSTSQDGFTWSDATLIFSDWSPGNAANMTVFEDSLYLCVVGSDFGIYVASLAGGGSWPTTPTQIAASYTTNCPVAISTFGTEQLVLAFVSESKIYIATSTTGTSDSWVVNDTPLFSGTTTAQSVNLAYFSGAIYMSVLDSNNNICVPSTEDITAWPSSLTSIFNSFETSLPASLTAFEGQLYLSAVDQNNNIYIAASISGSSWPSSPKQILTSATSDTQISLAIYSNLLFANYVSSNEAYGAASGGLVLLDFDMNYVAVAGVYQAYYADFTQSNGVSSVDCGDLSTTFAPQSGFTFETWVNTSSTAKQSIFAIGSDSSISLSLGEYSSSNSLYNFLTLNWGSTSVTSTLDQRKICDGKWHHIAVSVTGSNSVTFYKDGRPDGGYTLSSNGSISGSLRLGSSSDSDENAFGGWITQSAVWNTPLTDTQVQMYMNCDLTQLSDNTLVGYWSFSDGADSKNLVGSNTQIVPNGVSFPKEGTPAKAVVFFNLFDASQNMQNLLPVVKAYVSGVEISSIENTIRTAIASFAQKTSSTTLTSKTEYLALPSLISFLTIGEENDSSESQLLMLMTLNNNAPPSDNSAFSSIVDFSTFSGTNNLFALCDYSFWSDVVLPMLTQKLKNNASDFTVNPASNGNPPTLTLKQSKTFGDALNLTLNSLNASIPNNADPTQMPQQVIASNVSITFALEAAELLKFKADVPVYVEVTAESEVQDLSEMQEDFVSESSPKLVRSDNSETFTKRTDISKYKWKWQDYIFTFLVALTQAVITTGTIFICANLGRDPQTLAIIAIVLFFVFGAFLIGIAEYAINHPVIASFKSTLSVKSLSRSVQNSSDVKAGITLISNITAIVLFIVVVGGALMAYFLIRGQCWKALGMFIVFSMFVYALYWLIVVNTSAFSNYLDNSESGVLTDQQSRAVSSHTWTLVDYVVTFFTDLILALGTAAGIFLCTSIGRDPELLAVIAVLAFLVFLSILILIAFTIIDSSSSFNFLTDDSTDANSVSPMLTVQSTSPVLKITSDAKISVSVTATLIGLLFLVFAVLALAGALLWTWGACRTALVFFIGVILLYYALYWLIVVYGEALESYLEDTINDAIDQNIDLDKLGNYSLLAIVAENNSLRAYGEIGIDD